MLERVRRLSTAGRYFVAVIASIVIWTVAPVGPARAATATIVTSATPTVTIGNPISDTATVTGAPSPAPGPTGTVTFNLFGPSNPICSGPAIFTTVNVLSPAGQVSTAFSSLFIPTTPGSYQWVAVYNGDANYSVFTSPCGAVNETSVVNQAVVTITTAATSTVAIGSPIMDTATVTGAPAPAPTPTGTVTFTLFGPANPTCAGAPVFTSSARPLGGGPPRTATSGSFTPTAPGTYNWVAVYNGDANYTTAAGPCGAPNESSVVVSAQASIVTTATPTVTIGYPISDTATVTGSPAPAPAPTGTVSFTLYGPSNPTCAGAPVFSSGPRPISGGPPSTATSSLFVPTSPGSYFWVAVYSGDASYPSVTSPCGAVNETSVVLPAQATITTSATPSAPIGSPIMDTAMVTGASAPAPTPTGTVTFTLFGPANPTCTGAPVFTSANRAVGGAPPPTASSAPFTPTTAGSYNWVAVYSGDLNYQPVASSCGAANETSSVVAPLPLGQLRVTTSPALPAQILLDGIPRDSFGLVWLKLVPGPYTLSFTHVEGWTEPAPQTVTVSSGAVTTITGTFTRRGILRVHTNPAVPGAISVDGVPRDDWGVLTDVPAGNHQVCFGQVAGFDPPGCQTVNLVAGAETLVTGNYVSNAAAPGPTNVGQLRVTSSPAVASQILVNGIARDTWGLAWLDLAPGSYSVSFAHVEGWTEPSPATVNVTAGAVTTVVGNFTRRGVLEVKTNPAEPGTISVDGVPRDDWGVFTDLPTGSHEVCFGPVVGFTTPPCTSASLSAGMKTTITGNYT